MFHHVGVLAELPADGRLVAGHDPGAAADHLLGGVEAAIGFDRLDVQQAGIGEQVREGGRGGLQAEDNRARIGEFDLVNDGVELGRVRVLEVGGAAPAELDVVGGEGTAVHGGDIVELDVRPQLHRPLEAVGARFERLDEVSGGADVGGLDAGAGLVHEQAAVDEGRGHLAEVAEVAVGIDGRRIADLGHAEGATALGAGEGVLGSGGRVGARGGSGEALEPRDVVLV